jgi:hypothetical protein
MDKREGSLSVAFAHQLISQAYIHIDHVSPQDHCLNKIRFSPMGTYHMEQDLSIWVFHIYTESIAATKFIPRSLDNEAPNKAIT